MKFAFGVAVGLVLGLAVAAVAGQANSHGMMTGQDFRDMGANELERFGRTMYVVGWLDGTFLAAISAGSPVAQWLAKCLPGMSREQVGAIVAKYLENHPERWNQVLGITALFALRDACGVK